jgi:putative transposase
VKYAWIAEHRDFWPVRVMCRALKVSASGYYAWLGREPSERQRRRQRIAKAAREAHVESHGIYGYRKVYHDLQNDAQTACCLETVRCVMNDLGLSGKGKRRFVRTTDSDHDQAVAENVLQRDFTAAGPNEKWLADLTYIGTNEGWLYLATVMDVFSRRVVGWSMSEVRDADLVCNALEMALARRCPSEGLVHHSDRGVQYTSEAMRRLFEEHSITVSMSRKGNPWDNAMKESFYGSLKTEWIDGPYATCEQARQEVFKYIEMFYNPVRRHASLGYLSPAEYERRWERGELDTESHTMNQAA